jgi:UDP-N-acetylglucosamine 2-epimerase
LHPVIVLSVVGNRPQFIKSAPLSVALREQGIEEIVLHTGQHYDRELSDIFFEELELPEPQYSLGLATADPDIMRPPIADAVAREEPDCVLVYGDTNSTLAGAQAAGDVPVAHIEAGLRSGDWSMAEERNRVEVDRIARLLFAPDERSRDTLRAEAVSGRIEVVGDVMADASMRLLPIARRRSRVLANLDLEAGAYAVATLHREANTRRERLQRCLAGLGLVGTRVIFPLHPRTAKAIDAHSLELPRNVTALAPLGYLDFAALASQARVILTDSGGLQKEAYWYGVPCVTLRPSTEWIDTVELGANELVDDDPERIAEAARRAEIPANGPPLYGDGHASERIARILAS